MAVCSTGMWPPPGMLQHNAGVCVFLQKPPEDNRMHPHSR